MSQSSWGHSQGPRILLFYPSFTKTNTSISLLRLKPLQGSPLPQRCIYPLSSLGTEASEYHLSAAHPRLPASGVYFTRKHPSLQQLPDQTASVASLFVVGRISSLSAPLASLLPCLARVTRPLPVLAIGRRPALFIMAVHFLPHTSEPSNYGEL